MAQPPSFPTEGWACSWQDSDFVISVLGPDGSSPASPPLRAGTGHALVMEGTEMAHTKKSWLWLQGRGAIGNMTYVCLWHARSKACVELPRPLAEALQPAAKPASSCPALSQPASSCPALSQSLRRAAPPSPSPVPRAQT
ncbi:hypothetical protein T484DRAFT_1814059 [Baffinella frigidus]|nr:hypothetical protein T484DRAFT_1814059 [Cryptophyta sp. CCMP2293]